MPLLIRDLRTYAILGVLLAFTTVVCTPTPVSAQTAPRRAWMRVDNRAFNPTDYRFLETAQLTGSVGPVYSLAWSPDNSMLASAGYQQAMIWNPATGLNLASLTGHRSYIWGMAWSPDGELLATASSDGTVKLWDADTHNELASWSTGWAMCVAWSPEGDRLAVGTRLGKAQIWDVASRTLIHEMTGHDWIVSAAWSSHGDTLAIGDLLGRIVLWDPATATQLKVLQTSAGRNDANGLAWSPDNSMLASAHQDGSVWLWDGETGEALRSETAHNGWARGVAFSPGNRLLVTTGADATAAVWSMETFELLERLRCPLLPLWSVAWSPDGYYFALGGGRYESSWPSGKIFVWQVIGPPP